jgi:hypothetical protein
MMRSRKLWIVLVSLNAFGCSECDSLARAESILSEFKKNPYRSEVIPDNSFAGVRKSFDLGKMKILNVKDFGAVGDGLKDDSASFQGALDKAMRYEKVQVQIPRGRYRISEQIRISRSRISIQGEGSERTVLLMTRPLTQLYSKSIFKSGKESFSWKGGLFDIGPEVDLTANYAWGIRGRSGVEILPASRGDAIIQIDKLIKLRDGELIWIEYVDDKNHALLNSIAGIPADRLNWEKEGKVWLRRRMLWPVRLKKKIGFNLHLEQPLRLDIRKPWRAVVHSRLDYVHDVEVRGLSIEMEGPIKKKHLEELGYNGVYIHRSVDVLVDDVRVKNADNGFLLESAKNVTLSNVSAEGHLQFHHPFFTKDAHDVLIEKFKVLAPSIHGLNSDRFGSGNVWREGSLSHGTFDPHHGMQFDLIRTKIEMKIDGKIGGDASDGPHYGRKVVNWNIFYSGLDDQEVFKDSINIAVDTEPYCKELFFKNGISDLFRLIQEGRRQ